MHLLVGVLDPGEIPIYELEGAEHSYQWDGASNFANGGIWDIRPLTVNHRVIISLGLDEPLTVLVAQLSDRLQALPQPLDGSLILSIRSVYSVDGVTNWESGPDQHGIWIVGVWPL